MALACDFSWARPPAHTIKSVGYDGVVRYLSPDPTKNLTSGERDAYHAAGLGIALVYESYNQRAASTGARGGAADAALANAQADALGWPDDRPIYFVLEDPTRVPTSQWDSVFAYAKAARQKRPIDGYGSEALLQAARDQGLILHGWQVGGWSATVDNNCAIYQRVTATLPNPGGPIDEDVILNADWGQWSGSGSTVPSSQPVSPDPRLPGPWIPAFPGTISEGSRGAAVTAFQSRLKARAWPVTVDGNDGPETTSVIRQFQAQKGLKVDGVGGPLTWHALWSDPITNG